jgi:hypothetical protein
MLLVQLCSVAFISLALSALRDYTNVMSDEERLNLFDLEQL